MYVQFIGQLHCTTGLDFNLLNIERERWLRILRSYLCAPLNPIRFLPINQRNHTSNFFSTFPGIKEKNLKFSGSCYPSSFKDMSTVFKSSENSLSLIYILFAFSQYVLKPNCSFVIQVKLCVSSYKYSISKQVREE